MLSNEQLQRKLSGVLISSHTNNYGKGSRLYYLKRLPSIIHSSSRRYSIPQRDVSA